MPGTSTPTTTHVFVNGTLCPHVHFVEVNRTESKKPLFGILSKEMRGASEGRTIIEGTIGVYHTEVSTFLQLAHSQLPDGAKVHLRELEDALQTYNTIQNDPSKDKTYLVDRIKARNKLLDEGTSRILGLPAPGAPHRNSDLPKIQTLELVYSVGRGYVGDRYIDVHLFAESKSVANGPETGAAPIMTIYRFFARRHERIISGTTND